MTSAAKLKSTYPAAARFFQEITGLFEKPVPRQKGAESEFVPQTLTTSVVHLRGASEAEIEAVSVALKTLSAEVENLRSHAHSDDAGVADNALDEALQRAHEQSTKPMVTEQSIKEGEAFMEQMREDAAIALQGRIERGELILSGDFQERVGVTRQALSKAQRDGRLFSIVGPSGVSYYPAFFADQRYDRRVLEKVAKELRDLPGTVKYHFFTSKAFSLGSKTPLDALAQGRVDTVLRAAAAYAER